jgi:hypothetical protein
MEPEKNTTGPAVATADTNTPAINLNGRIAANSSVSCRVEGDAGAILFNADTNGTLLINPTGVVIWNFIGQPRTIDEIVKHVAAAFSPNPGAESLRKDVESFITNLAPEYIEEVTP